MWDMVSMTRDAKESEVLVRKRDTRWNQGVRGDGGFKSPLHKIIRTKTVCNWNSFLYHFYH